jgi:hypothetical protein
MRRLALLALFAAAAAGCVSVAPLPDPKGALRPGQRLVVAVFPSPGPWILDAADSKAEAAAKISPVGFLMQSVQDEHTLKVSQDLQQYMPRPHYVLEVQDPLLASLKHAVSSTTPVQTALEAGIVPAQLVEWNKAKDQLDWRARYYAPDPDLPAPRDYARVLTLDDALILDVNVSYGITAADDGRLMPQMSAASRVYRGDTSHMIWEHEDEVTDVSSSATLVDFKLAPADLTARLEALAPKLGLAVGGSFSKAFFGTLLTPSTMTVAGSSMTAPSGGLLPASFFQHLPSTAAAAGVAPSTTTDSVAPSTASYAVSSSTQAAPAASAAAYDSSSSTAAYAVSPSTTQPSGAPPPAVAASSATAASSP